MVKNEAHTNGAISSLLMEGLRNDMQDGLPILEYLDL